MIWKAFERICRPLRVCAKKQTVYVSKDYFTEEDISLFKTGAHFQLHNKLGAHRLRVNDTDGFYFTVWAPQARWVSVVGDFNNWQKNTHRLVLRDDHSGIWEGFIAGVAKGDFYKFHIVPKSRVTIVDKSDPYAVYNESAPNSASIIYPISYRWGDEQWMNDRKHCDFQAQAMSIYEVHLGSWRRHADGNFMTYRELADTLVPYVRQMGFTHVEFLPLMEHPFYGSWGYQALSYFAPTSRYGTPEDLMYLIDTFHQNGIGVLFDWVVSHFPYDEHGIANFDGTHLYETRGLHPDWQSCMFNLGRLEIADFLISSALYWIEHYHIDGLRVDAVASMLYLDYSRGKDEWQPNIFGGRENLESISFIRKLNEVIHHHFPDVTMIAEDSTAWPNVSKPVPEGGLGFNMKWNMGWMHDTLRYFRRKHAERPGYADELNFCLHYAFSENFVLSLSHDEVVYEKSSLIGKMPGNDVEKFSDLKALLGYMYAHPGKKLLFMGSEFAQWSEWNHDSQLEWDLTQYKRHKQIQKWVRDLNRLYVKEQALYASDFNEICFEWLDRGQNQQAVFGFQRADPQGLETIMVLCNFMNKARRNYKIDLECPNRWEILLNSDDVSYGGNGIIRANDVTATEFAPEADVTPNKRRFSITLNLPALSVIFLKKIRT